MLSRIGGGGRVVDRSLQGVRPASLVMSFGMCLALIGCALMEPSWRDEEEAPQEGEGEGQIFRLTEEELPKDSGALRSLTVSLETADENSRRLVWWTRYEGDDRAREALPPAAVRYGRSPEGFRSLVGPEPLEPCSSYGVTMVFVQGATRIEFETPCE